MTVGDDDTLASARTTVDPPLPELIAERYRIVRWLGGGGMGRVYEAIDTELDERVALKVLRAGLSDEAIERFRREVRLTRKIQHRNVARMFDIGAHGDERFLTMELVDGSSLTSEVRAAPIPWTRLRPIAAQIAAGLAAAHHAGVVHRDLKPDNVLIETATGRVVITDFGIARSVDDPSVTQVGAVIGTPRYMAPEQLAGRDTDARADLFALGLVLYELASGRRPWSGESTIAIAVAQATLDASPLDADDVPPSFIALVTQCLQLDPAGRPSSADELVTAIEHGTVPITKDALVTRAARPSRPLVAPAARAAAEPEPVARSSASSHTTATTIAVLPLTCAPGDEYLADGVVEDLIDTLSSTALRVRPAGMVRSKTEPDPRVLGRELAVDHVVVGSLRRTPSGLRLTARLLSVADGFQIWAHREDCAEADILRISEQVGRGIATALSTRAATATRPTDPRAVELYLRARAELRRYWGDHAQAAADLLEQAAEYAPNSEPILGALAFATTQAWMLRSEPELAPRVRKAIERGMATGHGEAYLASAIYKFNVCDLEAGAAELATALIRAPMSAQAHEVAARILIELDAKTEALRHFETATGLDPGRAQSIAADLARIDALAGDWDSASARIDALLADSDPSIQRIGMVLQARLSGWRGDTTAMRAAGSRLSARHNDNPSRIARFMEASANHLDDATQWRRLAEEFSGTDRPNRPELLGLQLMTEIAMIFDRPKNAIESLRVANKQGLMDITWLDACPLFMSVVRDPEFRAVRAEVATRAARVLAAFRSAS